MRRRDLLALIALAAALPAARARAGEGEGGGKPPPEPFIAFGPVAVSTVAAGGRRGVMTVDLQLHASDPALRERAELYQPYLRSAYVSALQRYALGLAPAQPPSPDWIGMALQRETDRVLGRRGVRVLLGTVLVN
jgi:hypothetical protein